MVKQVQTGSNGQFLIHGLVIVDCEAIRQKFGGVTVVADQESVPEYICQQWIDEVLIVLPNTVEYPVEMMEKIEETGVTVHFNLTGIENNDYRRQFVENIASYTVLTTSLNSASAIQLMLKRLMDILGGLVGCVITGILFLFVAPAIYISSPGPIFFSQERIGRNGKRLEKKFVISIVLFAKMEILMMLVILMNYFVCISLEKMTLLICIQLSLNDKNKGINYREEK